MPTLPEKWYLILKWVTLIVMPALGTALFTIGQIWSWEDVAKVVGTLAALNTLLGVSVGLSTVSYNASDDKYDGTISPHLANASTGDSVLNIPAAENVDYRPKEVLLKVEDPPPIAEF